ncbi:SDR family NAD(P)-dependent oxidoreductase [Ahrensia sp. R2A130]|uniref:SDR family NAD(P)-dependent oxidoreductase n=1 Tax=Ahrensia sp. R2A130 TaxID=744979 RepID=UPI0001E0F0F5|nr:SDR family oxidoreductase [Ahrensia sp. R2A130]EFL89023.1 2,5-dichloro-2,5-cyclohexadiene-1,4-diol dehydrogenase [Ahrensia sp. R2A130]
MSDFAGKTVLITGAAGGFGRAMAQRFSAAGAKLVLSDYNAHGLGELSATLDTPHWLLAGSVGDEDHCAETVAIADRETGRLDIAINNAGIGHMPGKTADIDSKQATTCVQVNLMGVFFGMKHQLPLLLATHEKHGSIGNIVNFASLAGIGGAPTLSMYSAAKHGVVGLTKSSALEYARRGVRINALCPAFARTPMVEKGILAGNNNAEGEAHLTRGIPMKRLAEVNEIVQAVEWFCAEENSFMTGQAVALDGGTSAM